MKRREVLRGAVAAGLAVPALSALAQTRHTVDAALTDHATSTDLSYGEGIAERYGYHGQDPAGVLAEMHDDFRDMTALFGIPHGHACALTLPAMRPRSRP